MPLDVIKLVVRYEAALLEATLAFSNIKAKPAAVSTAKSIPPQSDYDIFVSYSRADEQCARYLCQSLNNLGASVFIDTSEIEVGMAWLRRIGTILDRCTVVAALYSPEYLKSKMCQFEFDVALSRQLELGRNVLFPILLMDSELPTFMRLTNYRDCRVLDRDKLTLAANEIVQRTKRE